jgi:hypothetical protein
MTTVLHANDEVLCLHCQRWHAVQQENVGRTPAENLYRYVTCGGQLFYVGSVGTPSRWPTRQPPIWTVTKDTRWLECCLRSEGELGWAVQFYRNGLLCLAAVRAPRGSRGKCRGSARRLRTRGMENADAVGLTAHLGGRRGVHRVSRAATDAFRRDRIGHAGRRVESCLDLTCTPRDGDASRPAFVFVASNQHVGTGIRTA